MALSLLHPGSPFDPSIKYYSPHRTVFILLPPYLIFLLLDKDIGLSPTYFTTIQTACTLYLHHNFLRFHTTCEWAWSGHITYVWSAEIPRSTRQLVTLRVHSALHVCVRVFWRGQHFNNYRLCQAISCKCPQFEEHFRNGPAYRGFNALIGQREAALPNHLPAIIHNAEHKKLDGHVSGRTLNHLTKSDSEPSVNYLSSDSGRAQLLTVSAITLDFYSKG